MPIQFQPPSGPTIQDKKNAQFNDTLGTVSTLASQWADYSLRRKQQELEHIKMDQMLALEKQKNLSNYGTGESAPTSKFPATNPSTSPFNPNDIGGVGSLGETPPQSQGVNISQDFRTPISETPEQQQARLGTDRYGQLHQPQYVATGVGADGQPTFSPLPVGTKPGPVVPQPTTVLSSTGANLGTVPGKPTVLPAEPTDKEAQKRAAKIASEKPKALGSYNETVRGLDNMIKEANAIKDHPSLSMATGSVMGRVQAPNGPTNVAKRLDTLKAQTLLNVLTSMRQLSANGSSGFGQLSENEGKALENSITSLDRSQSTQDFKDSIDRLTTELQAKKDNLRNTFISTYGDIPNQAMPHSPDERAAGIKTVTSQAEYDALPSGTSYFDSHGHAARKK